MKKRVLTSKVLCVCMAAGLLCTGCGKSEKETTTAATTVAAELSTEAPQDAVTIEEQVLVDEKEVKVTAKRVGTYKGDLLMLDNQLILEAENHTDKLISVGFFDSSVNGYMIDCDYSSFVQPGETREIPSGFNESQMEMCGITTLAEMEFAIRVTYEETYEDILSTEPFVIKTSAADDFKYEFDESGTVAYDKDGFKIVVHGVHHDNVFAGEDIVIYASNQSDKYISVSSQDEKINGQAVEAYFGMDVLPGKSAMGLLGTDSEHAIEKIESFEGSFSIQDYENGDNIVEKTDPVSVTF